MNILIISDADTKYGASKCLKDIATNLKSREYDITVLLPNRAWKLEGYFNRFGIHTIKGVYSPMMESRSRYGIAFWLKYFVCGINYIAGRYIYFWILSKNADLSDFDIIHSNSSRDDFGALISNKYNIPLVWHLREHGDSDYNCYSYRKNYIEYMNQTNAQFIAVSNSVKDAWVRKGINSDRITVIYDGVELPLRKNKKGDRRNGKLVSIIMMGSISKTKGQEQLIKAISLLNEECKKSVVVDIYGSGKKKYLQSLKKLIKANEVSSNINFKGYRENIYDYISNYDIGIVCSKSEGFGRVTAEYMMFGLATIASNSGANIELIEDGKNGLLYRSGDIADLSKTIEYLLLNPSVRKNIGETARKVATMKYSVHENIDNICEVFDEIACAKEEFY